MPFLKLKNTLTVLTAVLTLSPDKAGIAAKTCVKECNILTHFFSEFTKSLGNNHESVD